jgi:hypothetical protein
MTGVFKKRRMESQSHILLRVCSTLSGRVKAPEFKCGYLVVFPSIENNFCMINSDACIVQITGTLPESVQNTGGIAVLAAS